MNCGVQHVLVNHLPSSDWFLRPLWEETDPSQLWGRAFLHQCLEGKKAGVRFRCMLLNRKNKTKNIVLFCIFFVVPSCDKIQGLYKTSKAGLGKQCLLERGIQTVNLNYIYDDSSWQYYRGPEDHHPHFRGHRHAQHIYLRVFLPFSDVFLKVGGCDLC